MAKREIGSGVGERFAGAGAVVQFADFEDFAAVEAFDKLRVVILGNDLRAFVFARIEHREPRKAL